MPYNVELTKYHDSKKITTEELKLRVGVVKFDDLIKFLKENYSDYFLVKIESVDLHSKVGK